MDSVSAKGILKFIVPTVVPFQRYDDDSYPFQDRPIWYYPRVSIHHTKNSSTSHSSGIIDRINEDEKAYRMHYPIKSEFTLLWFCDSHCRNSLRFAKILGTFLKSSCMRMNNDHDTSNPLRPCQCIVIPNDNIDEGTGYKNFLFAELADNTDFWHMGFDHSSRLSIIRLLSISVVPTLVVINNTSGRLVTRWGMEAIESNLSNVDSLLRAWNNNQSGVSTLKLITSTCVLS